MSIYTANVFWRRRAEDRFVDGRYSRAHAWSFDGGAVVPASSSPHVVRTPFSDPSAVDPEEALVASLSSCHMLFFLDFAKQGGFVVESYADDAEGVMEKGADGRIQMTRVTLKPVIVFSGDKRPTERDIEAIHHKAHDACYIANSVKSEIVVEGSCEGLAAP
jgi:organic hydroperoxide reductase OsmC/OhrA